MKIFLCDLAHTFSVNNESLTVPLNIAYIQAYAKAYHAERVNISLYKNPDYLLSSFHEETPEIIGFANYGWNENLNYTIGKYIRKNYPKTLIIAGGPNIDPDPVLQNNFLKKHNYIDYYVTDGGEETFSELIELYMHNELNIDNLPENILFLNGSDLVKTEPRKLTKTIDNIESPYLNGYLDEFLDAGMVPMFESNRGCPFKCSFCAWGSASKDLVRRLDIETTLAEINYVSNRSKARNWIFCDANFGILKRDVDIAKAIREAHEKMELPKKCHIWLAKNVTERNLEIGEILGDMTVPVMAIQSLDENVLKTIKRDNISTDTYVQYQQNFHKIGSKTYSDLIVPLPNETLNSHLDALSKLISFGVDKIMNHNMRLLSGAETNSTETREEYRFKTKYRIIHGDAGIYNTPDGTQLKCFEYEESLRSTNTMTETELFYLRKIHFLFDFSWNNDVYRPLMDLLVENNSNPLDIIIEIIKYTEMNTDYMKVTYPKAYEFFMKFEEESQNEWFDTEDDIVKHFSLQSNFEKLLNQEYEKINIKFSILLLKDCKEELDQLFKEIVLTRHPDLTKRINDVSKFTFMQYPSFNEDQNCIKLKMPKNTFDYLKNKYCKTEDFSNNNFCITFNTSKKRKDLISLINKKNDQTLSKIINTQGYYLSDLKRTYEF